jgi:hypothetical protein
MSFDPDSFGAPSSGRGRDTYDDYGSSSQRGESKFRTIPLVVTILFGIIAIVCTVISFTLNGTALTASEESLKSGLLLGGIASFIGLIVAGRKITRKR